jgi:hypothetical protein
MREECIKRMEMLKLDRHCINAFKRGEIWESEGYGALYELNDKEKKMVEEFEKNNPGCMVYHLIHNVFEFGECYSMLFVGNEVGEWELEKEELREGYVFSYVKNVTDECCSEFGSIVVRPSFGGLIRIG